MSLVAYADDLPKPVLITFMVLGFIVFWPIGLAVLAYLFWSGRMGCSSNRSFRKHGFKNWSARRSTFQSSGNMAFDEYREETLKRLEEEYNEFQSFMERLRRAKDQEQFDRFMSERNGASSRASSSQPSSSQPSAQSSAQSSSAAIHMPPSPEPST